MGSADDTKIVPECDQNKDNTSAHKMNYLGF